MISRILALAATLLCLAPAAQAARQADVWVAVSPPGTVDVYSTARYDVTVGNSGNKTADNVTVQIDLPETHTSPTVYVMGIVGAMASGCSQSGTSITCNIGRLRKNKQKTVWFEVALPVSAAPADFFYEAFTDSSESSTANNTATSTTSLNYQSTPLAGPRPAHNEHCTGQDLLGFYECTISPGSISSHDIVLESLGDISFPGQDPSFTGDWSQPSPDRLVMNYFSYGNLVASFDGYGVGGDCFEGITTFPNSQWNSAYSVCVGP